MELTKKVLQDRLDELRRDRATTEANMYALDGAIQQAEWSIRKLDEVPKDNVKSLKEASK